MQMNILFYISAFLTGILASMGLGGGMILILYMTLIAGMEQLTAQGVNLLFFIPIAAAALIIHTKNKLVKWKKIVPAIICAGRLCRKMDGQLPEPTLPKASAMII